MLAILMEIGTFLAAVLFVVVCFCFLASTLRLAILGRQRKLDSTFERFVTSEAWALLALVGIPLLIGEVAREEISPLPWLAFDISYYRNGFLDGVATALLVTAVDLWILVMPALTVTREWRDHRRVWKVLLILLNIAFGGILLMPVNPIYTYLVLQP